MATLSPLRSKPWYLVPYLRQVLLRGWRLGFNSFQAAYSGDNDYNSSSSSCAFFLVSQGHTLYLRRFQLESLDVWPVQLPLPLRLTAQRRIFAERPISFSSNMTTISGCSAVTCHLGKAQCTTSAYRSVRTDCGDLLGRRNYHVEPGDTGRRPAGQPRRRVDQYNSIVVAESIFQHSTQ